jgi:hypothetical protein
VGSGERAHAKENRVALCNPPSALTSRRVSRVADPTASRGPAAHRASAAGISATSLAGASLSHTQSTGPGHRCAIAVTAAAAACTCYRGNSQVGAHVANSAERSEFCAGSYWPWRHIHASAWLEAWSLAYPDGPAGLNRWSQRLQLTCAATGRYGVWPGMHARLRSSCMLGWDQHRPRACCSERMKTNKKTKDKK